ncbi:phosphoesterase [Noviherbaspirillum sp. DKR-6]|uniref:Phosphoesterase n=2 Tax=Noviherbaspirillum pedocola TaxID=2801341 RepID=A0A934SYB1_9BURK|nr:phosphoesterase [Noviherbaspirillum pedocola]
MPAFCKARRAILAAIITAIFCWLYLPMSAVAAGTPRHVFVVMLENENYAATFGPNSATPYLAQTLPSQGALLTQYYGIGHNSLTNYIALTSGQAPNPQTQGDCQIYSDWQGGTQLDANGQLFLGSGCVLPTTALSIANQMQAAGISWKAYTEDMGNDLNRDGSSTCAHPVLNTQDSTQKASATDSYAARHNPFMYYHAVIDDVIDCNAKVVNLKQLDADLASAATTPAFSLIIPNLCNDGHDQPCADGRPGGLPQVDSFLRDIVPKITGSAAFKKDGLLLILFDEASTQDASACCNEIPGPLSPLPGIVGMGGGRIGAVLLSPFIKPGTISDVPYNHYSTLRSVEDFFHLPYLGFAGAAGMQSFGSDVFSQR